jgi:glutamine phosphoribosylpyrophosphate amidotransferase
MDIIDKQTDSELLQSLLAETAKAKNEVRCAQQDLQKATGRLNFVVMLTNKLIERQGD